MTTSTDSRPEADPVLVALAARNPEWDAIQWRVRLPDDSTEFIAGRRDVDVDPRTLRFDLDDGTVRTFDADEWTSLVAMPGPVEPDLDAIIFRAFMFGEATQRDMLRSGGWLQAQPEWIEEERRHLAADSAELADMERIHALRAMGL
jgi:hypothetical protein